MGRDRRRLCGRRGGCERTRRPLPLAHRAVQASEGLCLRRSLAEEQLRQDRQERAARARPSHAPGRAVVSAPIEQPFPVCGKPPTESYLPFCSKRCADIDLHRWLTGSYAIPAEEDEERDGFEDGEDVSGAGQGPRGPL